RRRCGRGRARRPDAPPQGGAYRLRGLLPLAAAFAGVPRLPRLPRGRSARYRGGVPLGPRAAHLPRADRRPAAPRGPELRQLPAQARAAGGLSPRGGRWPSPPPPVHPNRVLVGNRSMTIPNTKRLEYPSFTYAEEDPDGLCTLEVLSGASNFNRWMYETVRPY